MARPPGEGTGHSNGSYLYLNEQVWEFCQDARGTHGAPGEGERGERVGWGPGIWGQMERWGRQGSESRDSFCGMAESRRVAVMLDRGVTRGNEQLLVHSA